MKSENKERIEELREINMAILNHTKWLEKDKEVWEKIKNKPNAILHRCTEGIALIPLRIKELETRKLELETILYLDGVISEKEYLHTK